MHMFLKGAGCAAGALLLGAAAALEAATLTAVPMQGGMVMPMISYSNSTGRLHVMMPGTVPQLTPLLVSNPADSFDPGDPWFDALDPSATALSFSRRYGFMMEGTSDPLPANTAIWLRKVSGPAALSVYRYAGNVPKAFDPIFGTAGTSNAMYWSGSMFHPTFAAPPGTATYQAVFEAYLVDTLTNQELPNTAAPPMTFNFTNLADGRPELDLALKFAVGWDPLVSGWGVESSPSLTGTNWTLVTNVATTVDGQAAVLLLPHESGKYYRMRRLP